MYAILSHGGRQYRVSTGDRLLVDRLDAEVGSVVALEPVLLTGGDGRAALGKDVDGLRVAVTVIAHRRGEKLRIFKYKAKKRSRKVAGYRSDLTELRVESILVKGAALPKAPAGDGAPQATDRPAPTPRVARAGRAKAEVPAPSSTSPKQAEAPKPKAPAAKADAGAAQAATPAAATAGTGAATADDPAGPTSGAAESAPAKPKATGSAAKAKPAPKPASKGGTAAKNTDKGRGA